MEQTTRWRNSFKNLEFDKFQFAEQKRNNEGLPVVDHGESFVVHKYFIMVTIEKEERMCYNMIDYTPGGVYVEYY